MKTETMGYDGLGPRLLTRYRARCIVGADSNATPGNGETTMTHYAFRGDGREVRDENG